MTIISKFCCYSYVSHLGGDTPLEQCLSEANEAGFSGIEFGGKFPKKSEDLIPLLDKYNLKLCSGWYGANLRKNSVKDEISQIQEQLNKIPFEQNIL